MRSEDIAGTLLCNFPYLEAEIIICKKGGLLEENEKVLLIAHRRFPQLCIYHPGRNRDYK